MDRLVQVPGTDSTRDSSYASRRMQPRTMNLRHLLDFRICLLLHLFCDGHEEMDPAEKEWTSFFFAPSCEFNLHYKSAKRILEMKMKPSLAVDEMFPEGAGSYMDIEEAGSSSALLMDLAANEKSVHSDFFNEFEDLFDDEDLS
ncbi:hypothetical protein LSH36_499g02075 [Paralvinella palmiformis]|uniref:COP9 signalosome complex subunit 9 n=1 Tax=Paralvinella palmiformis TaxID=53620 RepID=A0AAD9MZ75_9ANNE|nr:hypothetical protein LSH36_499g02075 [Paralvinella palmiformis]